jgi:hypothetical protein
LTLTVDHGQGTINPRLVDVACHSAVGSVDVRNAIKPNVEVKHRVFAVELFADAGSSAL